MQYHSALYDTAVPTWPHTILTEEFVRTQRSEAKSEWNCTDVYYTVPFGTVR